jgi:hypothetical protein
VKMDKRREEGIRDDGGDDEVVVVVVVEERGDGGIARWESNPRPSASLQAFSERSQMHVFGTRTASGGRAIPESGECPDRRPDTAVR